MKTGNSVRDTDPADESGVAAVPGSQGVLVSEPSRSLRLQPLKDIQDIIDKLAVVTNQLRHPSKR
jgi:hypothetical protein